MPRKARISCHSDLPDLPPFPSSTFLSTLPLLHLLSPPWLHPCVTPSATPLITKELGLAPWLQTPYKSRTYVCSLGCNPRSNNFSRDISRGSYAPTRTRAPPGAPPCLLRAAPVRLEFTPCAFPGDLPVLPGCI